MMSIFAVGIPFFIFMIAYSLSTDQGKVIPWFLLWIVACIWAIISVEKQNLCYITLHQEQLVYILPFKKLTMDYTQDVFHIGEWEYRCKESLGGYTAIVRENGNTQETVFSLAGASPSAAQLLVSFGIAIAICLLIFYIQKKRYSGGQ